MDSTKRKCSFPNDDKEEDHLSLENIKNNFSRSYYNLNFGRRGSVVSSQSEAASVSGMFYEDIGRKGRQTESGTTDDSIFLNRLGSGSSRISRSSRDSKHRTKSNDSLQMCNRNLFLKKTNETINFEFENYGPDLSESNGFQCAAERLRLGCERKSSGEITTRSDLFFSDNLLYELNVDSQEDDLANCEQISQNYVPFQPCESSIKGPNELVTETQEKQKITDLWSKNFSLNKSQVVAYFVKRRREKKPCKGLYRRELYDEKFLDAPVPWQEDLETKLHLRHMYFYFIQMIIITQIAMSMVPTDMFYFMDLNKRLFVESVYVKENDSVEVTPIPIAYARTINDFWNYAEVTMINLLYWDFYFNEFSEESNASDLVFENKILGVARMRQVRVTENSCKVHSTVERFFNSCYGYYSIFSEETKPIKTGMENSSTATAWIYTEGTKLGTLYYLGDISMYGGGGYYLDLAENRDDAKNMIRELRRNNWISKATRAVFIDFNVYNANVNLFCLCKIVVEFPPVGGIITSADFQAQKLIRYLTTFDFFTLGCEFLYLFFIEYDTFQVIKAMYLQKRTFFYITENYLDLTIVILSYMYIIISIVRIAYINELIPRVADHNNEYVEFITVKLIQNAYNDIIAILMFFLWVKLFVFFSFTKTMVQFKRTLKKSLKDMLSYLPMFVIMMSAFAFLAYLFFGHQLKQYNSFWHSLMALFQAFLGKFSYYEIFEVNRLVGPLFYVAFVFFVFFVLLNVFIAIVNEAYATVKSQVIPNTPLTGDYIRRGFVNFLTCCKPRIKKKNRSKLVKKKMLFDDIQKALLRAGFTNEEVQIFFHKYDINCKNFLEDETKTRIMKDLELRRIDFSQTSEQYQINILRKKLQEYTERMEICERKLQPVIDKVDVLLHRL